MIQTPLPLPLPAPQHHIPSMRILLHLSTAVALSALCLFLASAQLVPRAPPPQDGENMAPLEPSYTCHSVGECMPCTDLERKTEPYCVKYGNKEAISCAWDVPADNTTSVQLSFAPLPVYRACARVKSVERARFFEFQILNIGISIFAASLLFWRQRKLAAEQYRRMVRRIGISA